MIWSDIGGANNDFIVALLDTTNDGVSNGVLSFFTGSPELSLNGTTVLNDGQWHHIVVTRDALTGGKAIYVDGKAEGTQTGGTQPLTGNPFIHLGANTLDNRYYTGLMDEVAFYNTVLSLERVEAHYQAGVAPVPEPGTLLLGALGGASVVMSRRRTRRRP